jgi:hypothetical protein
MPGRAGWGRKFLGALLLVLLLGGGIVAWRERLTLLSWFYVRNLARATEVGRERWLGRVVNLGEIALPRLFDCLSQSDPQVCANARTALERMTQTWGSDDPRTADLAQRLAQQFSQFSSKGKRQALDLAAGWFHDTKRPTDNLLAACSHLMSEAAEETEDEVQTSALELCGLLLSQPRDEDPLQPGKPLHSAGELVRAALHANRIENRLRAIRLTLHPGLADLLEPVAGLLGDESPQVRRAALLVVGPAREVIHDDQLLPCLHDPDPEVRRLCEVALGGRGLRPEYLELGRLLTDPLPAKRVQVLDRLRDSAELDTGLWLRRLSHDSTPSVRVAAMRAMTQQSFVDLTDRIDQMARLDSSPTVRQLAQFYLSRPRGKPRKN